MAHSAQQTPTNLFFALLLSCVVCAVSALAAVPEQAQKIPVVSVRKDADGISLKMNPGVLKLQVFSPDVIRVLYARGDTLPSTTSLAVIGKPARVDWRLTETPGDVILSTSEIEARVNRASGAITFFDKNRKVVLAEPPEGGKLLVG